MAITFDKAASGTMTLQEFWDYDDGSDAMYELEDGELIPLTAESEINRLQERVTVPEWVEGLYEEKVYTGDEIIAPVVLAVLKLTAAQVLLG